MQLKDYGEARQITLFEHGRVALQILTSDFDACPAEILAWLKSRWREENFLKYASENYGIDKICDYLAGIEVNTKLIGQPGPQDRERRRSATRRRPWPPPSATWPPCSPTRPSPRRQERQLIPAAEDKITARPPQARRRRSRPASPIPAKLPASQIDPDAQDRAAARRTARPADGPAAPRPQRRALAIEPPQRLPARRRRIPRHHPPDHHPRPGRHHHLHPRRDHRHTSTSPGTPRVARALALLIDEINATPPAMPGDNRPITYHLTPKPGI